MTSPYPFYFIFMPREASNLSEVRFGDVAVDEGMTNGPPIFAYLLFGPRRISLE
jgi:hypothetical protein